LEHDRRGRHAGRRARLLRHACMAPLAIGIMAIGAAPQGSVLATAPATAQAQPAPQLPAPPANGEMGFVVYHFVESLIQGKDACPDGPALKNREIFLATLPPEEQERIQKKENEQEFTRRWVASMMKSNGADMCTQFDQFPERATLRQVGSPYARGLNLDGDEVGSAGTETCAHENFTSPGGEKGIDNQAYRALGCKLEWRGVDGTQGDQVRGLNGFLASGEFTQAILLRGVDSLVNDNDVEVIYGNTPDRPVVDSSGKFIWHSSFTISDRAPRERNVLRGKIVNGVLTTEPTLIRLTQTWGQGGMRDLRGIRSRWTLHKGRLSLAFQPDGTLKGVVGGYQPMYEFVQSPSMGGIGSLLVAGIDCAGEFNTLKKLADGMRDPKTGQCTAISNSLDLEAVPAFVNDVAAKAKQKVASR